MPTTGDLLIRLTDLRGTVVSGITVDLEPVSGEPGSGGDSRTVRVGAVEDLTITGIPCRGGPGTLYRVIATAPHYRRYGFFQLIRQGRNTAGDEVEFWVKAADVKGIDAPTFGALPAPARSMLEDATMVAVKKPDRDLVTLSGPALYSALGPLRLACLLNIVVKSSDDATAGGCIDFIHGLLLCRQDRVYARVHGSLPARLTNSRVFKSADSRLHTALPGYSLTGESFKTRDAHANLQVTFMREVATGDLAADIDIDESTGIKHGMEVIRNASRNSRTNPYLIREFLLAADPIRRSLDPGYSYLF